MRLILSLTISLISIIAISQDVRNGVIRSHCSITAPKGLKQSNDQPLLRDSLDSYIHVDEQVYNYNTTIKRGGIEYLEKHGMTILNVDTIIFNNHEALFIEGTKTRENPLTKEHWTEDSQVLIFKGAPTGIIVYGGSRQANPEMKEIIKNSILSIEFDKSTYYEDNVDYTITYWGFGFVRLSNDLYTKIALHTNRPYSFMIIPNSTIIEEKDRHATEARISAYENHGAKVIESNDITIDGLNGFELIMDMPDLDGIARRHYMVYLFHDQGYYVMDGEASVDYKKSIKMFRKMAATFKRTA